MTTGKSWTELDLLRFHLRLLHLAGYPIPFQPPLEAFGLPVIGYPHSVAGYLAVAGYLVDRQPADPGLAPLVGSRLGELPGL